jgi:hypothetical protein
MRNAEQISEAISDLLAEVVELGKEAEASGYQGLRYHSTCAAFDLSRAASSMRNYCAQLAADKRADTQMQALTAMQRKAGAFIETTITL